jgi:serpin B
MKLVGNGQIGYASSRLKKGVMHMNLFLRKLVPNLLVLVLALGAPARALSAQTQALVDGNTAFALELYAQLKTNQGNLFFSPYSISTALAMTYAGARGDTEKQMGRVLHFNQPQRWTRLLFGDLQRQLTEAGQRKGIELSIANALWAQKDHPFLPEFLTISRDRYQADVHQVDFETAAESAVDGINRWVAERTKEKIQSVLSPRSLDGATRLVIADAIYFKGTWAKQYDKALTYAQPFHISAALQKDTPLMHHLDEVRYMENREFQAVELPYQGGELSMVILLPREINACGELEDTLTPALLARSLEQMKTQEVEILVPRFKLESKFKLKQPVAGMGMSDAFDGKKADFSGMDGSRLLFITEVFHNAWGEVNEEGTEAAAVTAAPVAYGVVGEALPLPAVLRADHPFIFFIRDTRSGTLLFVGRLTDPQTFGA